MLCVCICARGDFFFSVFETRYRVCQGGGGYLLSRDCAFYSPGKGGMRDMGLISL